jgi:hypothetical protein
LLNHYSSHGATGPRNIFREAMPIEAFASEGQQQCTADIRMGTELVHHPVSVGVGIASSKTYEMNRLAPERIHDLAGHVVSAFHQVGDNDAIADSFSSVRPKEASHCEGIN